MRTASSLVAAALGTVVLSIPAAADKIVKTDGKTIDEITIVEETLAQVIYKRGNSQQSVPSGDVLSVHFDKKPRLVDEADQALVDGDPVGALFDFNQYVDGQIKKPTERKKWAPGYSAYRAIQIAQLLDDLGAVIKNSDRMITNFTDSRYLPMAYLAKASAQFRSGKPGAAQGIYKNLEALVESKSLSKRWALEAQLGLILTDSTTKGSDKRDKLAQLASDAAQFPTVKNRARLAEGETYVAEAEGASEGKAMPLLAEAEKIFRGILTGHKADDETLAGAYAGLGDALIQQGIRKKDNDLIRKGLMSYLRVIVNYKDHSQYVSKSMFWSMRAFKFLEDNERYREMKFKLKQRYPDSNWASMAENY